MISKKNRLVGAILLVSGTTIGGGVLAMPVITGLSGFFPSLFWMTVIWLFMMVTAFYLLEVNLRLRGETNLISMTRTTLGKPGEFVAWIAYLLLLYALLSAYLLGCSQILTEFFYSSFSLQIAPWLWLGILFVLFSASIYFGTEVVDFLNRILLIGMFLGYFGLIALGMKHVNFSYLAFQHWPLLIASTSVITTSFGYHIIIPTLTTYLEHDAKLLRSAIFWGSLIPFFFYLLWQLLAMGVIPVQGETSLLDAAEKGLESTYYLRKIIGSPWITIFARMFAFFAIITSLLGVALSLNDFLADGLKIKKTHSGKALTTLLTFTPPCIFALFFPEGFIKALRYAGIFVAILLMLLPALMAWSERYLKPQGRIFIKSQFKVPGGKMALVCTIVFSLILIGFEVLV